MHPHLPDNYRLCQTRLKGLLYRLRRNPEVLKEYDGIIRDQLAKGIVQLVENPEAVSGKRHYLPHHAVIRKGKSTTRVRVVYDASARAGGPSLNDCLYKGPKFNQRILDILRSYRIAWCADIEKAFLMIGIAKMDRDALRFLWVKNIESLLPEILTLRFTRVVFGVSASPFLLNATLKHHIERFSDEHPELVRRLMLSLYVDNVVCGAETEVEAGNLFRLAQHILAQGGFNLRKFISNSSSLQTLMDTTDPTQDTDESYTKQTLGSCEPRMDEHKVLGIKWNPTSDRLVFNVSEIVETAEMATPTKRHAVHIVGRFYDPIGYLAPIIIRFKILLKMRSLVGTSNSLANC